MNFLIAKELDGNGLEEISSRSDRDEAITEAITASQQDKYLGSVITVMDVSSGACARLAAEKLPAAGQGQLKNAVLSQLERETIRAKA